MNKLLLVILLLSVSLTVFGQKNNYKIKMKIDGMKDSTCYLISHFGNQRLYKDTANFSSNGILIFDGKEHHPGGIYSLYTGGKILFDFVINAENLIDLETDTIDYIGNMKVKKSKENLAFFNYQKFIIDKQTESQPIRNKLNSKEISDNEKQELISNLNKIGKEVAAYRSNAIKINPNLFSSVILTLMKEPEPPDYKEIQNDSIIRLLKYEYIKNHFFDDVDFSDSRINHTPFYHNKLDKYFKSIVYPIPDSIISSVDYILGEAKANDELFKYSIQTLFNKYVKSKIMGMDAVYAHIGEKYYTHEIAFWADSVQIEKIQEQSRKLSPLLLGKQAINLTLLDTNGTSWINMHKDVQADYTVLVFWEASCGHCKKELPKLAQYIDSVKSTVDIKVYSVSKNHDKEWKKFIRDNNLDFVNVAIPKEVFENQQTATELILTGKTDLKSLNYSSTYDIFSTPQVYLLDKNKIIIGKKLDTDLLKTVIKKEESRKKKTITKKFVKQ